VPKVAAATGSGTASTYCDWVCSRVNAGPRLSFSAGVGRALSVRSPSVRVSSAAIHTWIRFALSLVVFRVSELSVTRTSPDKGCLASGPPRVSRSS
jgi:hypothetical protein